MNYMRAGGISFALTEQVRGLYPSWDHHKFTTADLKFFQL